MPRAQLVCAVDDDEALCESLDGLLRSAGYAVRTFVSGKDFLEWSTSNDVDCLILDFGMPGMNGLELRQVLRDRRIDVPVIFATGAGDDEVWSQLTSSGASAVFAKPLDTDALLEAVERAIEGGQGR